MHYWNRPNFEGLLKLADALDAHAALRPLARYCRCREQGLRRQAFAALEDFLTLARTFSPATARHAAIQILELNARTPEAHQFITHPLTTRFLHPCLRQWMDADPSANLPVRWLGITWRDRPLLQRALAMQPADVPVRKMLIDFATSHADFALHHLGESVLLDSAEEITASLNLARTLIASAPDPAAFDWMLPEIEHDERLIADWQTWHAHGSGTFPEWCRGQGRDYGFAVAVYYEKPA